MKRTAVLLGVLAAVMVTVIWFLFFFSPKRDELADVKQQITTTEDDIITLRGQLGRLRDIEDNQVSFQAARALLQRSIPLIPDLASVIDEIHLLAEETDVLLNSITPGLPTPDEAVGVSEVTLLLDVEAEYFELLGFLYGLEDMERLVRVDALSISGRTNDEGDFVLAVTLNAKVFTTAGPAEQPPAEESPGDEPPDEEASEEGGGE